MPMPAKHKAANRKVAATIIVTSALMLSADVSAQQCPKLREGQASLVRIGQAALPDEEIRLLPHQDLMLFYPEGLDTESLRIYLNDKEISELLKGPKGKLAEAISPEFSPGTNELLFTGYLRGDIPSKEWPGCTLPPLRRQSVKVIVGAPATQMDVTERILTREEAEAIMSAHKK